MRSLTLISLLLLLGACAALDDAGTGATEPERMYRLGKSSLDDGYYEMAIQQFEALEAQYPFGEYAQQAQLDIAYAHYKSNQPEAAIAAADHFIKTYPRHPRVDYAYYLRGLANFNLTSDFFDRKLDRDPARRDPRSARESFQFFSALVEKFPDSSYAADAIQRMVYLQDYLARHELYVAGYYMKRGAYVAALNRAKTVLETYPRTPAVPEALALMVDAYRHLGLEDLAADSQRLLELNHPGFVPTLLKED